MLHLRGLEYKCSRLYIFQDDGEKWIKLNSDPPQPAPISGGYFGSGFVRFGVGVVFLGLIRDGFLTGSDFGCC